MPDHGAIHRAPHDTITSIFNSQTTVPLNLQPPRFAATSRRTMAILSRRLDCESWASTSRVQPPLWAYVPRRPSHCSWLAVEGSPAQQIRSVTMGDGHSLGRDRNIGRVQAHCVRCQQRSVVVGDSAASRNERVLCLLASDGLAEQLDTHTSTKRAHPCPPSNLRDRPAHQPMIHLNIRRPSHFPWLLSTTTVVGMHPLSQLSHSPPAWRSLPRPPALSTPGRE